MGTVGASPARRRTLELNHFVKPATCCRFERLKPGNVAMSFADHSVVFSRNPPFESGTVPVGGTVAGTTYSYILAQGTNYILSNFSGKVLVVGNATLRVTDSLNFGPGDYIQIDPGANLSDFRVFVRTRMLARVSMKLVIGKRKRVTIDTSAPHLDGPGHATPSWTSNPRRSIYRVSAGA